MVLNFQHFFKLVTCSQSIALTPMSKTVATQFKFTALNSKKTVFLSRLRLYFYQLLYEAILLISKILFSNLLILRIYFPTWHSPQLKQIILGGLFMKRKMYLWFLIFISSAMLFLSSCQQDTQSQATSTTAFPHATPESQGLDSESLTALIESIENQKLDIHQILILRNGHEIMNANFFPYEASHKHALNSVTKNFTATLIGLAIDDGSIKDIQTPLLDFFPHRKIENLSDEKKAITLYHMLTMSSGLEWFESGDYSAPNDSCKQMYASGNEIDYVLSQPLMTSPGSIFNYSTGGSHVLSGVINKVTQKTPEEYAVEKLFTPLNITDYFWGKDSQGINTGGSRLFLKADDLAKLGQLYLNKGQWNGKQILSEQWIEDSTQKYMDTPNGPSSRSGYGYQWWMNSFGGYSGRGYNGQYLFVLPDENLVVVFFSSLSGYDFFAPEFLTEKYILKAIKSKQAITENQIALNKLSAKLTSIQKSNEKSAVPKLPKRLIDVSGKEYDFPNAEKISVDFKEGSDEAILHWFCDNSPCDAKIGLDNVYRINNCSNFVMNGLDSKVAMRGSWNDAGLFTIDIRALDSSSTYTLTLDYSVEPMQRNMRSND